eukprot:CAMPEP_0170460492 /NCGR_PEP_ID=MMETSP0123-20130129/6822_1 /TAXON_ID=182087 /ORGANISM="Favella ehrenbergii, Strain Fehren 1" /LENGTH=79 /DNA_ID=CAMNT_0010725415 /DNA_START=1800 /DNA_END=2039 /DNA_ORIENTATION=+
MVLLGQFEVLLADYLQVYLLKLLGLAELEHVQVVENLSLQRDRQVPDIGDNLLLTTTTFVRGAQPAIAEVLEGTWAGQG